MHLHFCISYRYSDNEKSLGWFLPSVPLLSEIPDTQVLEEEIEGHNQIGKLSHLL